jgi:hypothetical protein
MVKSLAIVILAIFVLGIISHSVDAQTEKPKAYGVLIDNTRSLEKRFDQVKLFSKRVVDQVNTRGPVQLFSFKWTRDAASFVVPNNVERYEGGNYDRAIATRGVDWTQDASVLTRYIQELDLVKGQTDLFGAIRSVAESLNDDQATSKHATSEKVIVLITDGDHRMEMIGTLQPTETDDERRKRDSKLRKYLKDSGIKVYAIGITGDLDTGSIMGSSPRLRAENYLSKVTKETGGKVVFSRSKQAEIDKLVSELLGP